ncbi:MAG: SWIM zinc finger family protein [Polyangiaceae bacterium]
MTVHLTEQAVAEMAPDNQVLSDGRGLVKKGALKNLAKLEDETLVFGQVQGSGKTPYEVSADFSTGGDRPTMRCSCPSQKRPCKHVVAFLLAYASNGEKWPVKEAPAALLEKRAKLTERNEKKATTESAPKKVNKAAQAKKTQEQSEALDTLETFVLDLISAGLGGLTAKNITAIDTQAKRMADAQLWGASNALQHLSALVSDDDEEDEDDEDAKKAKRGLSAVKQAQIASLVTQLWVTIRRGRKVLEGKLEEGATQSENDAQVESILGRRWQLGDLKEAGYWTTDRTLVELAHERADDPVTEFVSATGFMLDLEDGSITREWTSLPVKALKFEKLRLSRIGTLVIKEAALYPGDTVNRRIRWDEKVAENVVERNRSADDYKKLHAQAKTLDVAVKALQTQLKNPLDPLDAVFLIGAKSFGLVGDQLVLEDSSGARIAIKDPPNAAFNTTRNFKYAAGAFGAGSVALRLWYDLGTRSIYGQGLALIVGDKHIRLGM